MQNKDIPAVKPWINIFSSVIFRREARLGDSKRRWRETNGVYFNKSREERECEYFHFSLKGVTGKVR